MNAVEKPRRAPVAENYLSQKGGADHETLVLILVIVTGVTIVLLILGWIKSIKDERVENQRLQHLEQSRGKPRYEQERGPSGQQIVY